MIITGRTVLMGIVAFFGVVFLANGTLVYFALDSWPGLSTESAYEQGRDYNQTLAKADAQRTLGWTSDIKLSEDSEDQDSHQLRIRFTDADGVPIDGLQVHVTFRRPVGAENMARVAVPQAAGAVGEYRSAVTLPLAGRWYAYVEAGTDETVRYRMRYEVTVAP